MRKRHAYIRMGFDSDLDLTFKQALQEMIDFICHRTHFTPAQAYKSCSLAVDFRITQTVNGEKGVHGLLPKGLFFDPESQRPQLGRVLRLGRQIQCAASLPAWCTTSCASTRATAVISLR